MNISKLNQKLVPALLVKNMPETLAFYSKLGFEVTDCRPSQEYATWAEVGRDGVTLQFHTEPPGGMPPEPVCSGAF